MKSPQAKGKRFEREIAKYLEKLFCVKVRRTPCSGGIHNFMPMDIVCLNQNFILNSIHIECKNCEKLNAWQVYEKTKKLSSVDKIPLVVWSKNFAPQSLVILGQYDFFNILKELDDLRKKS